jgi:hypothetical protein
MSDLIISYDVKVRDQQGRRYLVQARGEPASDQWHGWLEFMPIEGGPALITDRETTQASRQALAYWASGLEPIYFEGAFERASRRAGRLAG